MNEIPNCPKIDYCHCFPDQERTARAQNTAQCVCGESEKALRSWLNKRITTPMSEEQRQWCYQEIKLVEGFDLIDYTHVNDQALAMWVLEAWSEYCRNQGLP